MRCVIRQKGLLMQIVTATAPFHPANPAGTRVAALITPKAGHHPVRVIDLLTGYGRKEGYDSLANARRAAYMLSLGAGRTAAGIYRQGDQFYVRAMGKLCDKSKHGMPMTEMLHLEGAKSAALSVLQDPRLVMLVDGVTQLWAKKPAA